MLNKIFILTYLFLSSNCMSSQTIRGELSYLRVDSTSHEYQRDLRFNGEFNDTVFVEIDGQYFSRNIDQNNYKQQYLNRRYSSTIYFDSENILMVMNNDMYFLTNRTSELTSYYRYENTKFSKISDYKISEYISKMKIEIYDIEIDKNDKRIIGGIEGYRISYKERSHGTVKYIKMYVSENIQFDSHFLCNFKSQIKMCPIYIEETNPIVPKVKSVIQLLNAKDVSKEFIAEKIQKIRLN